MKLLLTCVNYINSQNFLIELITVGAFVPSMVGMASVSSDQRAKFEVSVTI